MIKKIFDKRVLVEEAKIKKERKIILKDNSDSVEFEITRKVIQVSDDVRDVRIGDIPCISSFAKPHYVDIIENTDDKKVYHSVYYVHDIVGIEDGK